jgi:FdhD protein
MTDATLREETPRREMSDGRGLSPTVGGRILSGRGETPARWSVPEEAPIAVLVNGRSFAVMMATPLDLEDFAVGFALTEGLVTIASEIRSVRQAEVREGWIVNIALDNIRQETLAARKRGLTGRSGCGLCGAQTLGAALPRLPPVSGDTPSIEAIGAAFSHLASAQPLNAENRSTHAAAFCDRRGRILLAREDIGRHNALDKLGGALVRTGIAAGSGFVLLSGRVSVEMVQKTAALGVPFVAAISAPSALALRQAARAGIGLACRAGDGVMMFDIATVTETVA